MSDAGFSKVSTAGRPGSKPGDTNRSDWGIQTFTFTPSLVASVSPQSTPITLPANSVVQRCFIRVFTPESTGGTKTVTVSRGGNALAASVDVSASGVSGPVTIPGLPDPSGIYPTSGGASDAVTYALGSADFAELDCEVMITCNIPVV